MAWERELFRNFVSVSILVAVTSAIGVAVFGAPLHLFANNFIPHVIYSSLIFTAVLISIAKAWDLSWLRLVAIFALVPIIYTGAMVVGIDLADRLALEMRPGELGFPQRFELINYGPILGFVGGTVGGSLFFLVGKLLLDKHFSMESILIVTLILGAVAASLFGVLYGVRQDEKFSPLLSVLLNAIWQGAAISSFCALRSPPKANSDF